MKKKDTKLKRNKVIFVSIILVCLIPVFILAYFFLFLTERTPDGISGEDAFKKYIASPVPSGVTNIDADITEYQGADIYISFTVNSANIFQTILTKTNYRKVTCSEMDFSKSFVKNKLNSWKANMGSFECFEGGSGNLINKQLYFNRSTGDVIYNEIEI